MPYRPIASGVATAPRAVLLVWLYMGTSAVAWQAEPGFVSIFDGKDLTGWEGESEAWVVRDGAITCSGRSEKKNWLIWRGGQPRDFELRLRFKYLQGNSGVQVRSKEIARWQVQGYQAEIAPRRKMGIWHHSLKPVEHRHYLATAGQRARIAADGQVSIEQIADPATVQGAYRENEWNDMVIVARGPRLVQIINGVVFSELVDEDERFATRSGVIAFQDHGAGTVAQFKNIRLKRLAGQQPAARVSPTDVEELRDALRSLSPGTLIEIAPGEYELSEALRVRGLGTEERPIVVRAKQPSQTSFRGPVGLRIEDSSHVVVDGLAFDGQEGLRCQHSDHVRITNCRFQLEQTGKERNWLAFNDSRHGRVDHCEFAGRDDPGSYIHISRGNRFFRIDHNYLHDFRELGYNGGETIYLHGTGVWAIHAVVEHNLFERCNGEGELIGIKSHRNIIRLNTFKDCRGAVSIRDGNYNSVYGNVFLALDESRAAGVRIHGKHNAFVNNYLYGVYKPIECCWGDTDPPHRENLTGHGHVTKLAFAYRASYDNLIAHNTFVACDTVFQWTKKQIPMQHILAKMGDVERNGPFLKALWNKETSQYRVDDHVEPRFPARNWYVLNNVIVDTPRLVRVVLGRDTPPPAREEEFRWQGNLAYCHECEFDVGVERILDQDQLRIVDPNLVKESTGIFRPGPNSICRGQAEVPLKSIKSYVNQEEIAAVLAAATDLGAQDLKVLTAYEIGPNRRRQSQSPEH